MIDDIDDQEIFTLVLKSVNPSINCVTANDGIEAVTKLMTEASFNPDYIFLDLNMPRMSGKEYLQEIKKIDRLKEPPSSFILPLPSKKISLKPGHSGPVITWKNNQCGGAQKQAGTYFK